MSKNLKTQWRVQTKNASTGKWTNRGLFETRRMARISCKLYRECLHLVDKRFSSAFGLGNTRVVKYIKA